ncbi:metal-dependent phosphohydrolase [Motilimonas cestriensis]|uniref:Metal-dependent phosphohydrolase n=1 Tax=Motilimonas cestriensis TaxID=2742685 RepID=A0ABS8W5B5_9GAMM|nr:HD domain-containing phosphohydrolase [Motilimonas cestriensis]MCE2593713.1 metal-dependent phosphohydrolase [Motilimonas cestriensis]
MASFKQGIALHIHITGLFVCLILVCGLTLAGYSYSQISKLIIEASEEVFQRADREIETNVESSYQKVQKILGLLSQGQLGQGSNLEQRHTTFAQLWQIIQVNPDMNAVYAGYDSGDFYYLSKVHPHQKQLLPQAAQTANYLLTTVEHQQNKRQVWHQYYNEQGQFVYGDEGRRYDFDPRLRPWYQGAMAEDGITITEPYIFNSSQLLGITLALKVPGDKAVVAVDFTLASLSASLANRDLPLGSELVILDKQAQVIAYQDPSQLVGNNEPALIHVNELNNEALNYVINHYEIKEQEFSFDLAGENWLGNISLLTFSNQGDYYLMVLTPTSELLKNAHQIRNNAVYIAIFIIILTLPIAWFFSQLISRPLKRLTLELQNIKNFDFTTSINEHSIVSEVSELASVAASMKNTIGQFQQLSTKLSAHQSLKGLLNSVLMESVAMTKAKGGMIFTYEAEAQAYQHRKTLLPCCDYKQGKIIEKASIGGADKLLKQSGFLINPKQVLVSQHKLSQDSSLLESLLKEALNIEDIAITWVKLSNRNQEPLGILAIIESPDQATSHETSFIEALSGYCGLAIESQLLLTEQKELMDSFIELIASAIDSKSPYTGGHCSRVPEITQMLAHAACSETSGQYQDFELNQEQWKELHIASWLHDCGKITTPEFVVDKATKLETIYNRIHEIRMRFELLKAQAHCDYWQGMAKGQSATQLAQVRDSLLKQLDEEFAFVAKCNIGSEYMSPEHSQRLALIAQRTWTRTLDDRLGLSKEEMSRKPSAASTLPTTEYLLADKVDHLVPRDDGILTAPGNPWGFNMTVPEYKYNRGELHNLSIQRGTLTAEDRFIINSHIVYTTVMLSKLALPQNLKNVPVIAASHHERMDGTGYPKKIPAGELPLTARMMMIADVFEALTASDRPYKEAKTLSEAIKIMSFMVKDNHLDSDLFELFLRSGVYLEYAQMYLPDAQIDLVQLADYGIDMTLAHAPASLITV